MFVKGFGFQALVLFCYFVFFSSSSWFLFWVGFELLSWTFLSFLVKSEDSFFMSLSLWKFFFYQFFSSSVFLLSILLSNMQDISCWFLNLMFLLSMTMKLGIPPFHGWVIQTCENLPLQVFFFFNFLQKFGPILVFVFLSDFEIQVFCLVMLSIVGSLGGWNLFSFHRFMVYSSILNLGWLLSSVWSSMFLFLGYFFCYSLVFMTFFSFFMGMNESKMNFPSHYPYSVTSKLTFFMLVLSIMGIPPTSLFFFKMSVVKSLIFSSNLFTCACLLIFTAIFMYMYVCTFSCQLFSKMDMTKKKETMKPLIMVGVFLSSCLIFFFNLS